MDAPRDHLRCLLEPTAIAVIGASDRLGPGRQVIENLEQLGYSGTVVPINPKHDKVLGLRCYPSVTEACRDGQTVDVAAILLGRDRIVPIVEELGSVGVHAAWAFASGFSESGAEGVALQERLRDACRRHGVAFCGPNCVGFVDPAGGAAAFSAPVSPSLRAGNVSVVAQSGSISLALVNSARGIGFRFLVSSGNEAVLDSSDYIDYFLDDSRTDVVLAFLEQIRRPERFIEVAQRARTLGKPLIVLKVGRSELGRRATVAHTGALAGSDAVYGAVFRKYGVVRVGDLDEMLETAEVFSHLGQTSLAGARVGMLTVSGGEIGLVGDLAEGLGFEFPDWSDRTRAAFAEVLPPYADLSNPLDAWGSGRVEETYVRCVDAAVEDDVDIVVISQDAPRGLAPNQIDQYRAIAEAAAAARTRSGRPIVAISHLSGGVDETLRTAFAAGGIPLLQGTREGLLAVHHLIAQGRVPREADAESGKATARNTAGLPISGEGVLDEVRSKQAFRAFGIPCVEEELCPTEDAAANAATRLGYPVVLKAISPDLPHKTEAGAVALNLADEAALREAYRRVFEHVKRRIDPASLEGILVQPMILDAVAEVIVGIVRDETFGPVVVFGSGGTLVELFEDRSIGIPPLSMADARELISQTKMARLLDGFRGRMAGDVEALAEVIVQVGRVASQWGDRIRAIDINPLLVLPKGQGVVAVDGLIDVADRE